MDFEDATEEVMLAVSAYRVALEAYAVDWRERHGCPVAEGEPVTTDLCKGASYGLVLLLRERFPDAEWGVDGGWGMDYEKSVRAGRADRRIDPALWPEACSIRPGPGGGTSGSRVSSRMAPA